MGVGEGDRARGGVWVAGDRWHHDGERGIWVVVLLFITWVCGLLCFASGIDCFLPTKHHSVESAIM